MKQSSVAEIKELLISCERINAMKRTLMNLRTNSASNMHVLKEWTYLTSLVGFRIFIIDKQIRGTRQVLKLKMIYFTYLVNVLI